MENEAQNKETEQQIFPHEIVEYSVEKHFSEYNTRSHALYLSILGVVFIAFILMFIVKVDITVRSAGSISPGEGRAYIKTPINGVIDSVFVAENTYVKAGQPIMKVHTQAMNEKGLSSVSQRQEIWNEVGDIRNIIDNKTDSLKSDLYKQKYSLYQQRLKDAQTRLDLVNKNFSRYSSLYGSRVISAAEYDKYNYEKQSVEGELALIKEQQLTQWQTDFEKLNLQLQEMDATITAPINGFVQQLKGVQKGSIVSPNDILGQIASDSGLIADAFVLPKDIALVRVGAPVRMQVDAFDYNVWGSLKGNVVAISNDIFNDAGQPYFKVRCKIATPYLKLRNGYKGFIKSGMTLQARFVVTRRSLYQLLYDQTDDWLNPNMNNNANNARKNKA